MVAVGAVRRLVVGVAVGAAVLATSTSARGTGSMMMHRGPHPPRPPRAPGRAGHHQGISSAAAQAVLPGLTEDVDGSAAAGFPHGLPTPCHYYMDVYGYPWIEIVGPVGAAAADAGADAGAGAPAAALLRPAVMNWTSALTCLGKVTPEMRKCPGCASWLSNLTHLFDLDLQGHVLTALPTEAFAQHTQLQVLNLVNTSLTNWTAFDKANVGILSVYASNNRINGIPKGAFKTTPNIFNLDLRNNRIGLLEVGSVSNLQALNFLLLAHNNLEAIEAGVLDHPTLTWLDLSYNQLSAIAVGAFDNVPLLYTLHMQNNKFNAWPRALRAASNLFMVMADNNQITSILDGDFADMTALMVLNLGQNRITMVQRSAFKAITALNITGERYGDNETNGCCEHPTSRHSSSPPWPSNNRSFRFLSLALNWNPMLCDWKGPNLNDIACTRCLGGWVGPGLTLAPDADVTELPFCSQPPFGTINYSNRTLHASIPTVLELGNTVWSAAGPSIDDFVGYSDNVAAQVTYSLDFARGRAADLGCGDSVYGNTATDADDLRKDPDSKGDPFDMWRTTAMHMDSRLKLLRVVVTHNGTFTFDSCGSQYSVALGLYHDDGCLPKNFMPGGGGGGTCGELVHYDVIPVYQAPNPMYPWWNPFYNVTTHPDLRVPWHHGCDLGQSARRTANLAPGRYILVVRGHMWVDDPGGHYQVSLGCNHSAAAIRSDDNDPRGMSVDPRTGVVTATPQREGAYRDVALVATDGGNNSVVVVVWSFNVTARAADSPWQNVALEASLGSFGGLTLILMAMGAFYAMRARSKRLAPYDFNDVLDSMAEEMVIMTSTRGNKVYPAELRRADLTYMDQIGRGEYGTVHKAMLRTHRSSVAQVLGGTETITVAVKMLSVDPTTADQRDFLREAAISTQFDHANVMATLGVVTVGTPHLLVTKYYERGSLKNSLERNEHSHAELRAFCQGVASGAAHLASCKFVHRDLASRNVLVDIQMVPKIADFGLSRNLEQSLYYKPAAGRSSVAIRWCSPEVLLFQRFSEASDVWAYGVVVFEIFSHAELPYKGWTNSVVEDNVRNGHQLDRHPDCPLTLYDDVICPCLQKEPGDRPVFDAIVEIFADPGFCPVASGGPSSLRKADVLGVLGIDRAGGGTQTDVTPYRVVAAETSQRQSIQVQDHPGDGDVLPYRIVSAQPATLHIYEDLHG